MDHLFYLRAKCPLVFKTGLPLLPGYEVASKINSSKLLFKPTVELIIPRVILGYVETSSLCGNPITKISLPLAKILFKLTQNIN